MFPRGYVIRYSRDILLTSFAGFLDGRDVDPPEDIEKRGTSQAVWQF